MGAHHPSLANHLTCKEFGVTEREFGKITPIEDSRGGGDASEHQAVPGSKNLLVTGGPDATCPRVIENSPRPGNYGVEGLFIHSSMCGGGSAIRRHEENVVSLKVSAACHAIVRLERG